MLEPPPATLHPQFREWPAGREIVRAHPGEFGATEFDRRVHGTSNRFSPLRRARGVVGVAYGAATHAAAASETVFHTVPAPDSSAAEVRPRRMLLDLYGSWQWSVVAPRRALTLVNLRARASPRLG